MSFLALSYYTYYIALFISHSIMCYNRMSIYIEIITTNYITYLCTAGLRTEFADVKMQWTLWVMHSIGDQQVNFCPPTRAQHAKDRTWNATKICNIYIYILRLYMGVSTFQIFKPRNWAFPGYPPGITRSCGPTRCMAKRGSSKVPSIEGSQH